MGSAIAFSVIVPMYNVEMYLRDCVESLRRQTLKNIEIILVDDGSPDDCGAIADAYALEDKRVRVVHRDNGGLGPARNSGMQVARGEYVGFVDSDDWVEPDMFERLYKTAVEAKADVVFTGFKNVSHGNVLRTWEHPFAGRVLRGQEEILPLRAAFYGAPPTNISDDPTPVSVWIAGYRRAFLDLNGLIFLNVRSEDKFFNTYACRAAAVVACISGTPYCYRKENQPSITTTFNRKTINSFFELFEALEQLLAEESEESWALCHVREQRCVVDYCRVLLGMIEKSHEDGLVKITYAEEVVKNPALRRACKGYPWWKLPIQQALFFLALKAMLPALALSLLRLKRGR